MPLPLDDDFGRLLPPQPRETTGIAYDAWESSFVPQSLLTLDEHSAERIKVLFARAAGDCPIHRTLVGDVSFIWIVDDVGCIVLAMEELVIDQSPAYVVKHQTLALTRNMDKLGHPALVSCGVARIGGEIRLKLNLRGTARRWVISNASGRYGFHASRTQNHLQKVRDVFSGYGIDLEVDWIQPKPAVA